MCSSFRGRREREIENHKELKGYKKMRQWWEREKDRKRGMVGERKIGREREGEGETGMKQR